MIASRVFFIFVAMVILASMAEGADFSLAAFLKGCAEDRILSAPGKETSPEDASANQRITDKIRDIDEKNQRVQKLLEAEYHYHLRAVVAPEKRFEAGLGWRKGDKAYAITLEHADGSSVELHLLINARSGRLLYYFDKEARVFSGNGSDDELTADEQVVALAAAHFYDVWLLNVTQNPAKYKDLLHPSVRATFTVDLGKGSRLLPPGPGHRADGSLDCAGIAASINGPLAQAIIAQGAVTIHLKREGATWYVLDLKLK